jgi:hypothetical protein
MCGGHGRREPFIECLIFERGVRVGYICWTRTWPWCSTTGSPYTECVCQDCEELWHLAITVIPRAISKRAHDNTHNCQNFLKLDT